MAEFTPQEPDHRVGDVETRRISGEFVGAHSGAYQGQCQISDHLRRGGDLHQPAQDAVGGRIVCFNLLESVAESQCDGLLTQVG